MNASQGRSSEGPSSNEEAVREEERGSRLLGHGEQTREREIQRCESQERIQEKEEEALIPVWVRKGLVVMHTREEYERRGDVEHLDPEVRAHAFDLRRMRRMVVKPANGTNATKMSRAISRPVQVPAETACTTHQR